MKADAIEAVQQPQRPALPEPHLERWQPLRLGLIELFQYDSEEFWFRDGHLLLRGNNGTGKSKVLSLSLPFLFDANLRPSRIEPDGDNGKKMAWNLLMGGYPRRIGYTWVEFGRRTPDGKARYLTLGAGLSAVNGKTQVESWYFILEGDAAGQDPRIGQDLWLTNDQRAVLTRDRLRETVEGRGHGRVFENAHLYRRAVDERLFQLGSKRYDALMDTLIQLRQPQLSKKPDEAGLSHALTEALPPLPTELLTDVAEALNQLEEDRIQLDRTRQLERAVKHFEQRYRTYAGTLTRRQARDLRQAQTGFDNASEERNRAHATLNEASEEELRVIASHTESKTVLQTAQERLRVLQSDPANGDANRLNIAKSDAADRQQEAEKAAQQCGESLQHLDRESARSAKTNIRYESAKNDLASARSSCASTAAAAGTASVLEQNPLAKLPTDALTDLTPTGLASAVGALRDATSQRIANIRHLERRHADVAGKQQALAAVQGTQREYQAALEEAAEQRAVADAAAESAGSELLQSWTRYCESLDQLKVDASEPLEQLIAWVARPEGLNPMLAPLSGAFQAAVLDHAERQAALQGRQDALLCEREALTAERLELETGKDVVPEVPSTRDAQSRAGRAGAPFWQLIDFAPHLEAAERASLEAALEASHLLDAWVAPDGRLFGADGAALLDSTWVQRPAVPGPSLADVLQPSLPDHCGVSEGAVANLLRAIASGPSEPEGVESWAGINGRYRLGALAGAWQKADAIYIGQTARARARARRLEAIAQRLLALEAQAEKLAEEFGALEEDRNQAQREWAAMPSDDALRAAIQGAASAEQEVLRAHARLAASDAQCRTAEEALQEARNTLH